MVERELLVLKRTSAAMVPNFLLLCCKSDVNICKEYFSLW
jgi:hypothetical protein